MVQGRATMAIASAILAVVAGVAANLTVADEPARVRLVLFVPALVAVIGAVGWRHRAAVLTASVLLTACVLVALASVGFLYLPSALLMILAASRWTGRLARRPSAGSNL